ncbi:MAG TPA: hypothetical protein VG960_12740 [Caulobacteraceae bacterium]|nr:hypothetical protein [Caulobacteraceae bacterium]
MDKDLAVLILLACHRSAKALAEIVPLVSEFGSEEDNQALRRPVGRSIHDILENIAGYVAARCPDAQAEFEARHDKYGRMV